MTAALALVFALTAVGCAAMVLFHAFRRSMGTGFMVLLVPFYMLVYVFTQFEHRRKGWVVAGLMSGLMLGAIFAGITAQRLVPPEPATRIQR